MDTIPIETRGDKDKLTSLLGREMGDFFTREIEEALVVGDIDIAVHSAKDLEEIMPEGLMIAALTRSISPFECLVSNAGHSLKSLPSGSRVATSSRRRKDAILRVRPDLIVTDVRGDIDERLAKLDNGDFDSLVVAHAALIRLGYEKRIREMIPSEIMEPHPLQGRLAVQIRRDRADLFEIFRGLNDA
jgi:hydroxymethylbilane synthase